MNFDSTKQYFNRFKGGNGEQAVRHMRAFSELVKKKNYEPMLAANRALKHTKEAWLTTHVADETGDDNLLKAAFAIKKYAFKELMVACKGMFEEVFGYFEQLLGDTLTAQWQDICHEETTSKTFYHLTGIKNDTGKASGLRCGALSHSRDSRRRRMSPSLHDEWFVEGSKGDVHAVHCTIHTYELLLTSPTLLEAAA